MARPKRRLVEFCLVLAFLAGSMAVACSGLAFFSQQSSKFVSFGTWVSSLLTLVALALIGFFHLQSRPRPSLGTSGGSSSPRPSADQPSHQLHSIQKCCSFLLNSINHGIVVLDHHLRVSYANDMFCNRIGSSQGQVLHKAIDQIFHNLPDSKFSPSLPYRLASHVLETGEDQSAWIDLPLEDGSFSLIELTVAPIHDEMGQNLGVLLLCQDRTAERELQETMRRNDQLETVSQMAASIAHEVRNPMTSVQGFLQLMSREIEPAHTHYMYLQVMEEDLKRINSIITEYLSFSRMDSGSREDVWIGTLLHNTYTLLQSEANLKGVQIVLSLLGNNPLMIANPHRIKQVLINLAKNAMEAMSDQGGGVLTLSLETTEKHVCLMVKDTGPGIPPEELAQIFQPFYTTKATGTGLGLSVSKKIVEEHNGSIEVETRAGEGTTFRILLPKNRLFED